MRESSVISLTTVQRDSVIKYQYELTKHRGYMLTVWYGDDLSLSIPKDTIIANAEILRSLANTIQDVLQDEGK